MQCETCHGTGQTPDPVVPKCGWCRDTGMAPRIMGDYLRTCNLCDAGKQMAALGWGDLAWYFNARNHNNVSNEKEFNRSLNWTLKHFVSNRKKLNALVAKFNEVA